MLYLKLEIMRIHLLPARVMQKQFKTKIRAVILGPTANLFG